MNFQIFNAVEWLSWWCSIALLVVACFYCFRKGAPGYMRSFPVYCVVNVLSEVVVVVRPGWQAAVYFLFTVFELLYFSFLLSGIMRGKVIIVLLWIADLCFLIFMVCYGLYRQAIPFGIAEECEVVILLGPCLVCYVEMVGLAKGVEIQKNPAFWMVTGIFFYTTLLAPTLLIAEFFSSERPDLARLVFSVNGVALIFSYLFYTKGITCWKQI